MYKIKQCDKVQQNTLNEYFMKHMTNVTESSTEETKLSDLCDETEIFLKRKLLCPVFFLVPLINTHGSLNSKKHDACVY